MYLLYLRGFFKQEYEEYLLLSHQQKIVTTLRMVDMGIKKDGAFLMFASETPL